MVTTQHFCAACGSEHIRRNGSNQGHAKYQCKAGGHQARLVSAAVAPVFSERGVRGLPLAAALPQAALALAQQSTPADPPPEPADAAAPHRHRQRCLHRAGQLADALAQLPGRAACARRRLAALPTLRAALAAAGGEPPAWLAEFKAEALAELVRSGSTAAALLRAQHAGALAEAAAVKLPID